MSRQAPDRRDLDGEDPDKIEKEQAQIIDNLLKEIHAHLDADIRLRDDS